MAEWFYEIRCGKEVLKCYDEDYAKRKADEHSRIHHEPARVYEMRCIYDTEDDS